MVSNTTTLVSHMIYSKCKGKFYLNLLHLTKKKNFVELYKSEIPQTASPTLRGLQSGRHLTVGSRTLPVDFYLVKSGIHVFDEKNERIHKVRI